MGRCLLHAPCSDLCLSSQAQGAKSLGSATDANVNSEENALSILWSVVKACSRSGTRYAPGVQVRPPIPTFSCHSRRCSIL